MMCVLRGRGCDTQPTWERGERRRKEKGARKRKEHIPNILFFSLKFAYFPNFTKFMNFAKSTNY